MTVARFQKAALWGHKAGRRVPLFVLVVLGFYGLFVTLKMRFSFSFELVFTNQTVVGNEKFLDCDRLGHKLSVFPSVQTFLPEATKTSRQQTESMIYGSSK